MSAENKFELILDKVKLNRAEIIEK